MTDQIKDVQRKSVPILRKAGVIRSSLFGSCARGEITSKSDVDFLIEFPEGKSLFDLVDLKSQLEEALQREVDVLTYQSVSPLLKNIISKEQVKIL